LVPVATVGPFLAIWPGEPKEQPMITTTSLKLISAIAGAMITLAACGASATDQPVSSRPDPVDPTTVLVAHHGHVAECPQRLPRPC
jgi:hypothetical protein